MGVRIMPAGVKLSKVVKEMSLEKLYYTDEHDNIKIE